MRDFTGKVALVTGGSRGIGAAVVKQFASQGADVAVVYAGNQELAEALCAQCAADYGVKAIAYRCDVEDFAAVKDTVNQVKKDFGSVDILVNNAGIGITDNTSGLTDSTVDDWHLFMDTNQD